MAVSIEESFAGAEGQVVDRAHHQVVANVKDAGAAPAATTPPPTAHAKNGCVETFQIALTAQNSRRSMNWRRRDEPIPVAPEFSWVVMTPKPASEISGSGSP